MTEVDLVAKKLALIETYLRELRELANPAALGVDLRERRFIEHTLQIAIQAVLDVASYIVSDDRLGEPDTNAQLFDRLADAGWISGHQRRALAAMAGFRNILVHGYAAVDLGIVRDVVENHLGDLEDFVVAVRARLQRHP